MAYAMRPVRGLSFRAQECALHTEQRVLHFAQDDKAISCDAGVSQAFCVASTQLWSLSAGRDGMGGELVAEELGGGLGGDGRREEVALAEEASEFFEGFTLRRLLDALGEDVDFPLLAQREEQLDDVAAGAVGEHVPDEKAVDLQKVDGDAAQLRERECAGSVVIDGGVDAELLELGDDVEGRAGIGRGDAVGDFQLKGGGVDLGFAKDGADAIGQVWAGEVARGDVGGDPQRGQVGRERLPDAGLAASFEHHPLIDVGDEADVLGGVDEFCRGDEAVHGVLPAHQGFEADDGASFQ